MKLFIFEYVGEFCYGGVAVIAWNEESAKISIQEDHKTDDADCPEFSDTPKDYCFSKAFEIEVSPWSKEEIVFCSYENREG